MLRAKAPEKPSEAGRQIGAAAVAAALGLDQSLTPVPEPSPPPGDQKPPSNIEALVGELAKAVAGRDLAERKAIIAQARSAFEAARRSAMPPPGESAVMGDLRAFDAAAAGVIGDPPQSAPASPAETLGPRATPPPSVTATAPPSASADPKTEQAAPAVVPASGGGTGSVTTQDPARVSRAAPPVWLRITLRVLIAAWLALGGVLGYAYLHHRAVSTLPALPAATPPPVSTAPAAPSAAPTPGKQLPVPDPLIPIE